MNYKCKKCGFDGEQNSKATESGVSYWCSECEGFMFNFSNKTPKGQIIKSGKYKGLTKSELNELRQ